MSLAVATILGRSVPVHNIKYMAYKPARQILQECHDEVASGNEIK